LQETGESVLSAGCVIHYRPTYCMAGWRLQLLLLFLYVKYVIYALSRATKGNPKRVFCHHTRHHVGPCFLINNGFFVSKHDICFGHAALYGVYTHAIVLLISALSALSYPFETKLHMLSGRWPGHLAWGHGSHKKQGENRHTGCGISSVTLLNVLVAPLIGEWGWFTCPICLLRS
jgi:hypothetical protein